MSLRQSFAWWSFAGTGLAASKLVRAAADVGYAAVEMPPREHWQLVKDHGLTILNTQAHPLAPEGLNRTENLPLLKRELETKLELARTWSVPHLICFSGNREGLSDAVGIENAVANLLELVPLAEQAGVVLVLELLNSKVDHPDYQADSSRWGLEVCKAVASPSLKLLYDVYHMQVMEGDLIRTIKSHHPYIAHYHTAGNPGRHDLDRQQEIAYDAVFEAIAATGYEGFVGHEFIPKGDPLEALKTVFELTRLSC